MIVGFIADYIEMPRFAGSILGFLLFVLAALLVVSWILRVMRFPSLVSAAGWTKKKLDDLFYMPVAKPDSPRIRFISAWSVGTIFLMLGFLSSALGALMIFGTLGNERGNEQ
ncbi:hypothetical protein [Brucella intermedia]|uniref:hypothetical protein n=1 Tax=Brucella intermedia TaxID=94625 RepID=UPI000469D02E|nr:hypothetical protein [Brucella intermedia]